MTQLTPEHDPRSDLKTLPKSTLEGTRLNFQGIYICPICRHGHISELTLMDAFSCDFCRHIFTANLQDQTVQVVDSSQPMSWRWSGHSWQVAHHDDLNLTVVIWLVGTALVALPSAIVWISAHTFPPLPDSAWSWFPAVWVGCTFLVHLLLVGWLMAEHYQLPIYVAGKIRLRALFEQR